jgi:signal transduction histidine kinase
MEERMKKVFLVLSLLVFFCCGAFFVGAGLAQEKATKEECVAKVKEAVAMVKEIGLEATLAKISDAKGPFQWKDTYVFCYNLDGVMMGHPNPKLVGKKLIDLKDTNGKMYVAEFLSVANGAGEGWVSYTWPKPGEKEASPKVTYVLRVPGENVAMFAGIYE